MAREYLPEEYTKEDRDLIKVFQQTMNELELAYLKAIHSNDTIKANAFLKQIKGVAKTLNDEYSDRADIRITEEYLKGVKYLDEAWEIEDTIGFVDFSKWKAKEMIWELWPAHVQAVNALLNTSKNYVKSSLDGLERQTMSLIGELQQQRVREELAKWILKGESRQEVNKKVTQYFEEQKLGFKDRAWRIWTMDRYVDMLTRTETAIANVQGTINRWIQVWLTKFRVIEHFDCCSTCANYNWEVFDVSKGIVSLPPYHPNCRGYIEAVIDWHDWGYHKELERKATYLWEGEFWPIYKWLKDKEAEDFLLAQKKWEVKGAYSYKWREVDAFYWRYDASKWKNDPWAWLLKLKTKHPEALWNIQKMLDKKRKDVEEDNDYIVLSDEKQILVMRKSYDQKPKLWVVSAYDRDEKYKKYQKIKNSWK